MYWKRLLKGAILIMLIGSNGHSQTLQNSITQWLVLGSFKTDTLHTALQTQFLQNEAELQPVKGETPLPSSFQWQAIETLPSGIIDFSEFHFPAQTQSIAYAATYIYSQNEKNIVLAIGSNDAYAFWLNKIRVHENFIFRTLLKGDDHVTVRLSSGWNRLLFKVLNDGGGWGLSVDLEDTEGNVITDLQCTNEKPESVNMEAASPFAYIDHYEFGPSYMDNGKRYYPLNVTIRNLGKLGTHSGRATVDTRRSRFQSKSFKLDTVTTVSYNFSSRDLWNKLNKPCGIRIVLNGKMNDTEIFTIEPEMIFASLFQGDELPEEILPFKPLFADFKENLFWYKTFTGEPFSYQPSDLADCVDHALHNEWGPFVQMLNTLFVDVINLSHIIKQDTLHMIGQSHIDMAWVWQWPETIDVCRRTYASAINFIDEYPDFQYIQSQAVSFMWMEEKYPDLFAKIQQAVKKNRFHLVGGMWVEPDLNLAGGEALIRQILYGKRYFREKFGVDCITGYTPDTFGYTWTLPQILAKSGFQYFVTTKIRWNDTTHFPHSIFRWISPDGSSILTCLPNGLNISNKPEELAEKMLEYKSEGYNNVPVLYGVGDHGGGPTRQHFESIKKLQNTSVFPALAHDDLDSYMKHIDYKYPDAPKYENELYLEYHRGTLTTQGRVKKQNRQAEIALEESEKLAVFSGIPWPKDSLETAWKLALFNQFHDILPGSSIPEVYDDADKDYLRVNSLTKDIINNSMQAITKDIDLDEKDTPVVVFNTLNWQRSGLVSVNLPQDLSIKEVKDDNDEKMPYQQTDISVQFIARDVPANGYKTFWLRKGKYKHHDEIKVGPTFLENEFVRVEIDAQNGNISRFFDKVNNQEILVEGQQGNILQFFEDKPDNYDAWNIGYTGEMQECSQVSSIIIKEKGPARAILSVVREYNKSVFTQDYTLYADSPRLDIVTQADWHEHHILAKAAFPVNIQSDKATFDIAYGSIERTTNPQTPAEKAKWEVAAHKYADLSDDNYGVSLMNDCKYGYDVKDNVMRLTLLRSPLTPDPISKPIGYENPYADQGLHEFTYSIYPHKGNCKTANSVRKAYELNMPLKAVVMEKQDGQAPRQNSYLSVNKENLIVTAVKHAEDSDALIIRLYETHGWPVEAELTLAVPFTKAWTGDMMENKLESLAVKGKTVTFSAGKYEIITLILE